MTLTRLRKEVERQARRMRRAEHERDTLLGQTVFLTTLGLLFVLPVVAGAYAGLWLDRRMPGYSVQWTVGLLLLGVIVGAVNVYAFIRSRS
ncbi:MAG: AtpZ/AtpI family protein [Ectothiorhodospiraceae bacterium]